MQAVDYARRNARWVVAAVGVMVVALVAAIVIIQSRAKAEREAAIALLRIQALTENGQYAEALPQLESLSGKYGSTAAGREGRLSLGAGQLAAGNAAAAEQAYRKALSAAGSDKLLEASSRHGLAGSLADQNKPAEAAEEYQKAAKVTDNPLAAEDWLQAGLSYLRAGRRADAIRAFQEVVANYPRSSVVAEARIRLREASASGS
jgi:tetratricopeptide (TPR) repeat protein